MESSNANKSSKTLLALVIACLFLSFMIWGQAKPCNCNPCAPSLQPELAEALKKFAFVETELAAARQQHTVQQEMYERELTILREFKQRCLPLVHLETKQPAQPLPGAAPALVAQSQPGVAASGQPAWASDALTVQAPAVPLSAPGVVGTASMPVTTDDAAADAAAAKPAYAPSLALAGAPWPVKWGPAKPTLAAVFDGFASAEAGGSAVLAPLSDSFQDTSQQGEQRHMVTSYLKALSQSGSLSCGKRGVFVEMGALDGVTYSNTKYLNDAGWAGLLVEASPGNCDAIQKHRPNAVVACGAACNVADETHAHLTMGGTGKATGLVVEAAVGGQEGNWREPFQKNFYDHSSKTPCAPMSHLLAKGGVHAVDFWSLDVEGSESTVLSTVNFTAVAFRYIVLELEPAAAMKDWTLSGCKQRKASWVKAHGHPPSFLDKACVNEKQASINWRRSTSILKANGFKFVKLLGGNELWQNPEWDMQVQNNKKAIAAQCSSAAAT